MSAQVRELEGATKSEREAARASFERVGIAHGLRRPLQRMVERSARCCHRCAERRIRRERELACDFAADRAQRVALGEHAQRIERQHVGGAFPNRQHLGIGEQAGQAGVFDIASAAATFDGFGQCGHDLLAGGELGNRHQGSCEVLFVIGGDAMLDSAEQFGSAKREQKCAGIFGFERR